MRKKIDLTLLGIWNILPIGNWTWFNDIAINKLKNITGVKLGVFCFLKNDLNYECFTENSTNLLRKNLEKLSNPKQVGLIKKISADYYKNAKQLEKNISRLESLDPNTFSNSQLANEIEKLAKLWSFVTMQIWYAVLLDIWYPSPYERKELKNILAVARDHCGHLHERSDKLEKKLYTEAAKRLNLSIREAYFMIQPELSGALRGKAFLKQKLNQRQEFWVESNHSGTVKVYEGSKAEKIFGLYKVVVLGEKKNGTLVGAPACMGKIKGRVRVITLDSEFRNFKQGEILVAIQTMVHYLPIMKKAKAILTEFGGMTSHAAIVSRELNKPCVVGVTGLINTLKTGDMVEVDANKGVVKII